jgi:hypothetical protein
MQFVAAHNTEILHLAVGVNKGVAKMHNTGLFWAVT